MTFKSSRFIAIPLSFKNWFNPVSSKSLNPVKVGTGLISGVSSFKCSGFSKEAILWSTGFIK